MHKVEGGGETDAESTIAVEQAGAGAVRDKVLASDDKHRHLGAVLARVEHLVHGEVRRVEVMHLRKELPVRYCKKKTASSTRRETKKHLSLQVFLIKSEVSLVYGTHELSMPYEMGSLAVSRSKDI